MKEIVRHTPFLADAFGEALIHSLWMGLLIWGILRFVLHSVEEQRAVLRYNLSVASLFVYLGSFVALFFFIYSPLETNSFVAPGMIPLSGPEAGRVTAAEYLSTMVNSPTAHGSITAYSLYGYLAGLLYMLARTLFSVHWMIRLRINGKPAESRARALLELLRKKLGITRKVRLLISESVDGPGLIGWFKPLIFVPAGMFTQLPSHQVETILMHELFHLRRLDAVVNAFQTLLETLFFYHPAIWAISGIVRTERERCCDDLVIQQGSDPLEYARALFKVASESIGYRMAVRAGGKNTNELSLRIKRILHVAPIKSNQMKSHRIQRMLPLFLVISGLVLLFSFSGFSPGITIVKRDASHNLVESSPRHPAALEIFQDTVPPAGETPESAPSAVTSESRESGSTGETDPTREEAPDTVDWEALKEELEQVRKEALESVDWEALKEELEQARNAALDSVDWEALKEEMKRTRKEVMESIDWEALQAEMEKARKEAMESIDWDAIRKEMEELKIHLDSFEVMEFDPDLRFDMKDFEFDFDVDTDFDFDFEMDFDHNPEVEIDVDQLSEQLRKSLMELKEIDLENIRAQMEAAKVRLDSLDRTVE